MGIQVIASLKSLVGGSSRVKTITVVDSGTIHIADNGINFNLGNAGAVATDAVSFSTSTINEGRCIVMTNIASGATTITHTIVGSQAEGTFTGAADVVLALGESFSMKQLASGAWVQVGTKTALATS